MKKIITIVLTAVLALTAAFSLAACGDKEAESVTIAVPNDFMYIKLIKNGCN